MRVTPLPLKSVRGAAPVAALVVKDAPGLGKDMGALGRNAACASPNSAAMDESSGSGNGLPLLLLLLLVVDMVSVLLAAAAAAATDRW